MLGSVCLLGGVVAFRFLRCWRVDIIYGLVGERFVGLKVLGVFLGLEGWIFGWGAACLGW